MNDRSHKHFHGYIRTIAELMGLSDWDIRLSRTWADDDYGATIEVWETQMRATMKINRDVFTQTDPEGIADQRRIVIHELLHCRFDALDELIRLSLKDWDDARAPMLQTLYAAGSEKTLDAIATGIAPLFPEMAPISNRVS